MTLRISLLASLILLGLAGLAFRAYQLQVSEAALFASRALANQSRVQGVPAARGRFLDRQGRTLVDNRVSVDVHLVDPRQAPRGDALDRLMRVLGLPRGELRRKLPRRRAAGYYLPQVLKEEVGTRAFVRLLEDRVHLPGVVPREMLVRHYVYETLACHTLGRVGRITPDEADRYMAQGYPPDAFIGVAGLERKYEAELRGEDGIQKMRVDALGWPVGEPQRVSDPQPGDDLLLSLDLDVQFGLERALASRRGSIVVLDPATGDLLGLASSPRFDPNHFNRKVSAEEWARLATSEEAPLLNRATEASYQPGSTFKVLTALAALQAGMDPDEVIVCDGQFQLGPRIARCWKRTGHGPMTMVPALAHSCNVYFYQAGLVAGIERLEGVSSSLGLGRASGIGVGGETPGVLPGPAWRRARKLGPWTKGDTINVAIGQGEVLTTPLQMARVMGAIENRGVVMRPRLVRGLRDATGTERLLPPVEERRLAISAAHHDVLVAGMRRAVNRGTAARTRLKGLEVYGKTGSAQNPGGRTHAWFVGVMRAPRGSVAVAVALENAGGGGREAAPVAKKVFQAVLDAGWREPPARPRPSRRGPATRPSGTPTSPIEPASDSPEAPADPASEQARLEEVLDLFAPEEEGDVDASEGLGDPPSDSEGAASRAASDPGSTPTGPSSESARPGTRGPADAAAPPGGASRPGTAGGGRASPPSARSPSARPPARPPTTRPPPPSPAARPPPRPPSPRRPPPASPRPPRPRPVAAASAPRGGGPGGPFGPDPSDLPADLRPLPAPGGGSPGVDPGGIPADLRPLPAPGGGSPGVDPDAIPADLRPLPAPGAGPAGVDPGGIPADLRPLPPPDSGSPGVDPDAIPEHLRPIPFGG